MTEGKIDIITADGETELLRELLGEYHEWLREHIPVDYDPAEGLEQDFRALAQESERWVWIARHDGEPAGCVLLYGESEDLAEFRRLWVRPDHRGHGIGRRLVATVIEQAQAAGYDTLGLTTPPQGTTAHRLYESLGFERTPPYSETRLDEQHHEDAIFMQLDLASVEAATADV